MTDRATAERLVRAYVDGWLLRDMTRLVAVLGEDVDIVECDGQHMHGLAEVRRWFADWHDGEGRVTDWRLDSISFDQDRGIAAVEWYFACVYMGAAGEFPGASVIAFSGDKIRHIREFRTDRSRRRTYRVPEA